MTNSRRCSRKDTKTNLLKVALNLPKRRLTLFCQAWIAPKGKLYFIRKPTSSMLVAIINFFHVCVFKGASLAPVPALPSGQNAIDMSRQSSFACVVSTLNQKDQRAPLFHDEPWCAKAIKLSENEW